MLINVHIHECRKSQGLCVALFLPIQYNNYFEHLKYSKPFDHTIESEMNVYGFCTARMWPGGQTGEETRDLEL